MTICCVYFFKNLPYSLCLYIFFTPVWFFGVNFLFSHEFHISFSFFIRPFFSRPFSLYIINFQSLYHPIPLDSSLQFISFCFHFLLPSPFNMLPFSTPTLPSFLSHLISSYLLSLISCLFTIPTLPSFLSPFISSWPFSLISYIFPLLLALSFFFISFSFTSSL